DQCGDCWQAPACVRGIDTAELADRPTPRSKPRRVAKGNRILAAVNQQSRGQQSTAAAQLLEGPTLRLDREINVEKVLHVGCGQDEKTLLRLHSAPLST
ncbi:MAG: hypothetical protein JWL97_4445, partial [Gemmatimonadales bacterium]|nr:hypothetical protein [Gemmatimonadales bacterium]